MENNPLVNPSIINGQLIVSKDNGSVSIDCNRSRQKMFTGLTPGTKYYFYAFAINATNVAPLSNPQSIYVS